MSADKTPVSVSNIKALTAQLVKKIEDSGTSGASQPLVPDTFELEDLTVQMGSFQNAGTGWNTFTFPSPFEAIPVVYATCEGYGVAVKDVNEEGFLYQLTAVSTTSATSKTLYAASNGGVVYATKPGVSSTAFSVLTSAGGSGETSVGDAATIRYVAIEKGGESS